MGRNDDVAADEGVLGRNAVDLSRAPVVDIVDTTEDVLARELYMGLEPFTGRRVDEEEDASEGGMEIRRSGVARC